MLQLSGAMRYQIRRTYGTRRRREMALLSAADEMIRSGCLRPDVCRRLGISHVVYGRLRSKYPQMPEPRLWTPSEETRSEIQDPA